jgi:hypothetical protein
MREVFEREVNAWITSSSLHNKFFNLKAIKYLIEIFIQISETNPIDEKLIIDIISGLALYPIYILTKKEEYGEELDRLMAPIPKIWQQYFTSENYQRKLISKEITGQATFNWGGVSSPITLEEILLHIRRMDATPIMPNEIQEIERSWVQFKKNQYSEKNVSSSPSTNPIFSQEAQTVLNEVLSNLFKDSDHEELKRILKTGDDSASKLLFLGNGNILADAMKQLKKCGFINGCQQKDLEAWIHRNFCYQYRNEIKHYTEEYLNEIISSNKNTCKHPLIICSEGKIAKVSIK